MFRNNLVVLADPPSSSPFLLCQLSLLPALSQPTSSSLAAVEVETLCWKISRRLRLACFLHHPDVFVIYQGTQSQSAERALEEFVQGVPGISVGAEEEVASASLVTKAVEIVFRTVMLDHKWACVGNNTFVDAAFAGTDERKNVGAFNLRVQSEMDDGFVLLVSPEVLRFSRYKVTDFVSSEVWESFYNGVCKLLPDEENFERPEVIWSLKVAISLYSSRSRFFSSSSNI